jgi:hypothetical protein
MFTLYDTQLILSTRITYSTSTYFQAKTLTANDASDTAYQRVTDITYT